MTLLGAAATFIWSKARLLDRLRFAHRFQHADRGPVVATLAAYQNADGGFGNGREPDLRGPVSQPQPVEFAFHILDEVDALDDPMVARALDYLLTIRTPEGGVPFVCQWPTSIRAPRGGTRAPSRRRPSIRPRR
jgi:hypothetical protein